MYDHACDVMEFKDLLELANWVTNMQENSSWILRKLLQNDYN